MRIVDLKTLVENAYSDGFSGRMLENLTGVPETLIHRYIDGDILSEKEIRSLSPLQYVLEQLYLVNVENGTNLKGIVEGLEIFFAIPKHITASYIGVTENQLDDFIENPKDYDNGYNLSLKLMHLFTTLVRDKKQ